MADSSLPSVLHHLHFTTLATNHAVLRHPKRTYATGPLKVDGLEAAHLFRTRQTLNLPLVSIPRPNPKDLRILPSLLRSTPMTAPLPVGQVRHLPVQVTS